MAYSQRGFASGRLIRRWGTQAAEQMDLAGADQHGQAERESVPPDQWGQNPRASPRLRDQVPCSDPAPRQYAAGGAHGTGNQEPSIAGQPPVSLPATLVSAQQIRHPATPLADCWACSDLKAARPRPQARETAPTSFAIASATLVVKNDANDKRRGDFQMQGTAPW